MNRTLVEINENNGASIDEYGNIRKISINSDEYKLEEILKKEDELENLNERLEEERRKYESVKMNISLARFLNSISVGGAVFMGLITLGTVHISSTLLISGFMYGMGKFYSLASCGTRKGRKEKREFLEEEIPKLEREEEASSIELWDMKRKVKFKEEEVEVLNNLEIPFNMDQIVRGEKTKVKVLDLRKRR